MSDARQIELLEELVVWARFANRRAILDSWDSVLSDDKHLLAYELSDGSRTQQQVAKAAGLSQATVSGLWGRWRRMGLARVDGKTVCHIARPSDFGMERAVKLRSASQADAETEEVMDRGQ